MGIYRQSTFVKRLLKKRLKPVLVLYAHAVYIHVVRLSHFMIS